MNKMILSALILTMSAHAQETGDAAIATVEVAKENNWQNWAFAGSLIVIATGAVLLISINNGKAAD